MGSRLVLSDSLKHLKLTQQHEDFELKKALLSILTTLSCDSAAVKVMSREKVVRAMLSFVVTNDKAERTLWNAAQFEELQLLVSKYSVCIYVHVHVRYECLCVTLVIVFRHSPVFQLLLHSVSGTI